MPFRIVVLLGVEIILSIYTVVQPFVGTIVMLLFLFTRPQDDRPNMMTLHFPMVLTISMMTSIMLRSGELFTRAGRVFGALALPIIFYVMMIVSSLINGYTEASQQEIQSMFVTQVTMFAMVVFVKDPRRFLICILALLVSGIYYVRMAALNPSFLRSEIGNVDYTRLQFRNFTNFGNPNYLALFMSLLLFLALGCVASRYWTILKVPLLVAASGYIYVFLKCQSRGATLGLVAGLIVFWSTQRRKLLTLVGAVLVLGIGLIFMAPETYFQRMTTVTDYEQDTSATGRIELWGIALDVLVHKPIFGVGPNNFAYKLAFNSQHNTYLQAATETGVPGALVMIAMMFASLRQCWVARKMCRPAPGARDFSPLYPITGALMACVVQLMLQGLFNGYAFREFLWLIMVMCFLCRMVAEDESARLRNSVAAVPAWQYGAANVPNVAAHYPQTSRL